MLPSPKFASAISPEYVILGLLDLQPSHGYELHGRLQADLDRIWRISLSQVYNILNRLEARGDIESELELQEKRPDRRRFHLTAAGRNRLESWLHSVVGPSVRAVRMVFTTKLYFARHRDEQIVRDLIESQEREIKAGLTRLWEDMQSIPPEQTFSHLSLRLRISQLESLSAWLQECGERLLKDSS